jgi:hypothetical protein
MIQIVPTLPQVMIMQAGYFPSYIPEHAAQQPKDRRFQFRKGRNKYSKEYI